MAKEGDKRGIVGDLKTIGSAIGVIAALAVALVALVVALRHNNNTATGSDVQSLRSEVSRLSDQFNTIRQSVNTANSNGQNTARALNDLTVRVGATEKRISTLEQSAAAQQPTTTGKKGTTSPPTTGTTTHP